MIAICLLVFSILVNAQKHPETDEIAIHGVMDRFMAAWNQHDAKAFAAVFSEDADFTNIHGIGASGRGKIEAFHAKVFASMFSKSHQEYSEIKTRFIRPEIAAVDVPWKMTGSTNMQGNPQSERTGLLNFVMEKRDGRWEIVVMHNLETSAFAPPPPK